jgi:N-formylglutamate amidohydrolase
MNASISLIKSERAAIEAELSPPVRVVRPRHQTSPFVFCSPHSGRIYPATFLAHSRLDALALRRSEDAYVDQLFSCVVDHGAPLIAAEFPRAFLDVNREPLELDPKLIEGVLPFGANIASARVAGGLGTIPRLVADGEDIYYGRIPVDVAMQRIERLYRPFHEALSQLLTETHRQFGFALLVDCHSMPSASASTAPLQRPHFVIGDRFGTSCAPELSRTIVRELTAAGYDVQCNKPYAGGFITEHYGRPHGRVHAVQIEINRALYLNEGDLQPNNAFAALVLTIDTLVGRLVALGQSWLGPTASHAAAE